MKIFEIVYNDGEKQWVAAKTNIEALREVLSIEETDLDLMYNITEVPEEKLDEWHVNNTDYDETDKDDWQIMTFREFLNDAKTTKIISATFYEL